MQATEILMSEHRVIERVLNTLDAAAQALQAGQPVRPGLFIEATDFVRGFADGCHHRKEEGVLFVAMADHGAPVQNGPIGAMLLDHEQGRAYTRNLRLAAERLQAGDASAAGEVIANALGYVSLLRAHIMKEDRILFPMADQAIPVEQHAQVFEGFEHVEHAETGEGVHEKFLALAEAIEAEIAFA